MVFRVPLRAVVVACDVERRKERVSALVDAWVCARDGAVGGVARADEGGELRGEVVAERLGTDRDLISCLGAGLRLRAEGLRAGG